MKGLTEYEKFLVIRPLPEGRKKDKFGMPIIKKDDFSNVDWNKVKYTSLVNCNTVKDKANTIPLMFHYDKILKRMWDDPLKYATRLSKFLAVPTPDFSAYLNMDHQEIEHNIYQNRWIGCWYQSLGIKVLPTITWAKEDTYDICFSGIEGGSIVVISTVGCLNCQEGFLKGFNEMVKRIKPPLILVRGKLIKGMTGNFIFIDFKETFNEKSDYEQMTLFDVERIINIQKEVI